VGDLSWVDASYDSIRGTFAVRWERHGDRLLTKISVPANCTADVFVPSRDGEVGEGGAPAAGRPGVSFRGRRGDRSDYGVGSGSYSFESRW
jgi:alpha-L-rhamnosidase